MKKVKYQLALFTCSDLISIYMFIRNYFTAETMVPESVPVIFFQYWLTGKQTKKYKKPSNLTQSSLNREETKGRSLSYEEENYAEDISNNNRLHANGKHIAAY